MSPDKGGIAATPPPTVWNRNVKADWKPLLKALTSSAFHLADAKPVSAVRDLALGTMDTVKLEGLKPNELAWVLIQRALARTMVELVGEQRHLLRSENWDLDGLEKEAAATLAGLDVHIEPDFFDHPRRLPVLQQVQEPFRQWLIGAGLEEAPATRICERIERYFAVALEREWRDGKGKYDPLLKALDTPATKASERERSWRRYSAWLEQQIDEPLFGQEAFSLRQIYIPLRAYFEQKLKRQKQKLKRGDFSDVFWLERGETSDISESSEVRRHVCDVHEELERWVETAEPEDAIRVISGGPGSGKSSLCKMFASQMATREELHVIYLPLDRLNIEGSLEEALNEFAVGGLLPEQPLDRGRSEERILLILDGLDELAQRGQYSRDAAKNFIPYVQKVVLEWNGQGHGLRVQALLSGRVVVIQELEHYFRQDRQILHLLPYHVKESARLGYQDPGCLLEVDQRQAWWVRLGALTGQVLTGLPSEFNQGEISELSPEPLLNYLLALSYTWSCDGDGSFQFSADTNLNSVYEHLVRKVYERGWAGQQQVPALQRLKEDEFLRVLEPIGLAVWQGSGRSASLAAIEARCRDAGVAELLEKLEKTVEEGVTRLLATFYLQRSRGGTVEFTHKTFAEYLASRRTVNTIALIDEEMGRKRQQPAGGWGPREALTAWAKVCGPQAMDEGLFRFFVREVSLRYEDSRPTVAGWQSMLADLFSKMLRHGMPMEQLRLETYQEESIQARNAEEALLAACSACARATGRLTFVEWPTRTACREWLSRTTRRSKGAQPLVLHCLNLLDVRYQVISLADLRKANLSDSDLNGVELERADLRFANLQRANLKASYLGYAHLRGADLQGADLTARGKSPFEASRGTP